MRAHEADSVERDSLERDSILLRRVRWRLAAWSGGITLSILLVLGTGFYVGVRTLLESASITRLDARVEQILPDGPTDLDDMPPLELVMGGTSSGTFAYLVANDGLVVRPALGGPAGLPDPTSDRGRRQAGA